MSLLSLDARWRRFNDETRACPCCGRQFSGIYDIGFDHPSDWPHHPRGAEPFVKVGADQLAADLCRAGNARYLKAVISLPVQGADEDVHITPWVRVPEQTFYAYLETWDTPQVALPAPVTVEMANELPNLDATEVTLSFPSHQSRPVITATDGPLAEAQARGISFDTLLDLYAACGDDIRPHLQRD